MNFKVKVIGKISMLHSWLHYGLVSQRNRTWAVKNKMLKLTINVNFNIFAHISESLLYVFKLKINILLFTMCDIPII